MIHSKFRQTQAHPTLHYYENVNEIPIRNDNRKCTDILCIIIGLGLTIILAIFAILTFNRPQYQKQVFPADSDGFTCGHEYPGFNYVYFAKPTQMNNRLCVRSCPVSKDKPLTCKKTKDLGCDFGSKVTYYPNTPDIKEYGQFCLPNDQGQKKVLMDQLQSYDRDLYYHSVRTMYKCLAIAGIVSLLYMLFVHCCPKIMNRVAVVVGIIALVAFAITIMAYPSQINMLTRWIVFAIAMMFILILICTFAKHYLTWGLNGVFLELGTRVVGNSLHTFILPIIFLAMGVAFYFFQALQYRSFWSFGQLRFDPTVDLYHHIKYPTQNLILSGFQIIQIIWGTMFLKEAFNYLISVQAVQWYYNKKESGCGNALFTLVCKHLGSVIACAFMNAFFGIADFICDALIPELPEDNGCFHCINKFAAYFDLARSDALTIVYVSGNAYCNSARYCEYIAGKLSRNNATSSESQTSSRIYRYTSHFAIGCIISLLAFWVFGLSSEVSISAMLVLLLISMGVATFFISLHADAAESVFILYFMEQQFMYRNQSAPSMRYTQVDHQVSQYRVQKQAKEIRKP